MPRVTYFSRCYVTSDRAASMGKIWVLRCLQVGVCEAVDCTGSGTVAVSCVL